MAITGLIGSSAKFRAFLDNVDMVAPVDSAVLIEGETGTGKEVTRAIQEAGAHSFEGLQSRDRSLALARCQRNLN